jgi:hypothetical protein
MLSKLQIYLMFILPFANEVANALTLSKLLDDTPFQKIYKPCDEKLIPIIETSLIDSIALFGIIWNTAYIGSKYGTREGCIYGGIVVILSFIIPNSFMETFVNYLPNNRNIRLFGMICFILTLLSIEIIASKYIRVK